jgi:hypothetical protein
MRYIFSKERTSSRDVRDVPEADGAENNKLLQRSLVLFIFPPTGS